MKRWYLLKEVIMSGKYNYANETLIDIKEYEKNVDIHEMIHKILTSKTTYGFMVDLLHRICLFDEQKKWLFILLEENMNRMQEIIATNYEILSYIKTDGFQEYLHQVEKLKKNKRYYKYFGRLSWTRTSLSESNQELGESIAYQILAIGLLALDVNIWNIPEEAYESEKNFKRFLSKDNNMNLYNPNVRFDAFIKYTNPDFPKDETLIKSMMLDCQLGRDNIYEICVLEILKIYKNSDNIFQVLQRIIGYSTIDMSSYGYTIEELSYLNAFPTNINDIMNNYKFELSFCDNNEIIGKERLVNKGLLRIDNTMLGCPINNTLAIVDYEKGTAVYSWFKDADNLKYIINNVKLSVAFFDIRTYPRFKKELALGVSKNIYFVMESSIMYNIDFIINEFNDSFYGIVLYATYGLLGIRKENRILLQLFSLNAKNIIVDYLEKQNLQLSQKEWNELFPDLSMEIEEIITNYFKYFNFALKILDKKYS